MTPDWLKEIEARLKAYDHWKQKAGESLEDTHSPDVHKLLSALKLAIEGLEFYANEDWDFIPYEGAQGLAADGGTKAREILEKINAGDEG